MGFATTIRPTMNLLDKNSSYQVFELTKEKVELTLINSKVAENQFNAALESFEKLEDKGFHIPSVQVFAVRLGLLSTVENISYSIDMMRISKETTKRSLLLGLRELYMGLYQAKESYQINDEKYQLEKDNYEMDLARFKSGLLSEIGLLTSKVNSLEAYANYAESINNYRIMLETFNQYIGQENLYGIYDLVKENPINMYYYEVDYYIDRALEMRSEVVDINRRLHIAYLKKELYEDRNGMYLRIEDINDDYIDLLNDIFELEVEKDEVIQSVTLEVIDSYNEMIINYKVNLVILQKILINKLNYL